MSKEFAIVYQDCPTCGARKEWGEKTIKAIIDGGGTFRKVSFASVEGQAHCAKAIAQGITTFPFVTDGENYAKDVKTLLEVKKTKISAKLDGKKTKKTKKTKEK